MEISVPNDSGIITDCVLRDQRCDESPGQGRDDCEVEAANEAQNMLPSNDPEQVKYNAALDDVTISGNYRDVTALSNQGDVTITVEGDTGPILHSNNTANDEEDNISRVSVIPDGGWGWIVVAASFLIHVVADGIVYSFGIFFVEFLQQFGGTHAQTSWLGALIPGISLSTGPISSALTNKYGCRPVTIAGALIAASAFVISIFAPNLTYLYFSFGIMAGLGFGLVYLPAIVSVTQYFEKRRAFATGLAVCGAGVGTFVFAPFCHWLIETFGWKGAILILAGVILNCVLFGAMFRPLPKLQSPDANESMLCSETLLQNIPNGDTPGNLRIKHHLSKSADRLARIRRNTDACDGDHPESISYSTLAVPQVRGHYAKHHHSSHQSLSHGGALHRRDVFYSGSIYNIPQYRSNPSLYYASVHSIHRDDCDAPVSNRRWFNFSPEISHVLSEMLNISLLKDPIFALFAVSNFLTSIGFNMPFIYLPDRAISVGISAGRAALLVSAIGVANTLGRIIFGWLSDRKWVNRLMLYNTSLLACGLGTALSPLANTFATLVVYACVFGMFIGVYVSLTSVVLVDLLGIERLTNSFGLLLLFQGLATFIGPPIAGWLYDATGSYDYSFIVEGIMIAISGAMLYVIPILQRRRRRRNAGNA